MRGENTTCFQTTLLLSSCDKMKSVRPSPPYVIHSRDKDKDTRRASTQANRNTVPAKKSLRHNKSTELTWDLFVICMTACITPLPPHSTPTGVYGAWLHIRRPVWNDANWTGSWWVAKAGQHYLGPATVGEQTDLSFTFSLTVSGQRQQFHIKVEDLACFPSKSTCGSFHSSSCCVIS